MAVRITLRLALIVLVAAALIALAGYAALASARNAPPQANHPQNTPGQAHQGSPSCTDGGYSCARLYPESGDYWRHSVCDGERDAAYLTSQTVKANGDSVFVSTRGEGLVCDGDTFYATREPIKHRMIITNAYGVDFYKPWSYH